MCWRWKRRPHLERSSSLLTLSVSPTWLTLSFTVIHHSACQHLPMALTATVICDGEQLGSLTWFAHWGIYPNRLTVAVKRWCPYLAYTTQMFISWVVLTSYGLQKFRLVWILYFCLKWAVTFFLISMLVLTIFSFSILYCSPRSLSPTLPLSSRP